MNAHQRIRSLLLVALRECPNMEIGATADRGHFIVVGLRNKHYHRVQTAFNIPYLTKTDDEEVFKQIEFEVQVAAALGLDRAKED